MNNTSSCKRKNNKPRYYVRVSCCNGKIVFCKITSKNKRFKDDYFRKSICDLTFVNNKKNPFVDSYVDKTLFTKVNGEYIDDVPFFKYLDFEFDNKSSKVIFAFLMESERNRLRFEEFCKDNCKRIVEYSVDL